MKKKATPAPALSSKQKAVIDALKTSTHTKQEAAKKAAAKPAPKKPEPDGRAKGVAKMQAAKAKVAEAIKPKPEQKPAPKPKAEDIELYSCWKRGGFVYEVLAVRPGRAGEPVMVELHGGRTGVVFTTEADKLLANYEQTKDEPTNIPKQPPEEPKQKAPTPIEAVLLVDVELEIDGEDVIVEAGKPGWIAAYQGEVWFAPMKKVGGTYIEPFVVTLSEWRYAK